MRMNVSRRGDAVLATALGTGLFAALFQDVLIALVVLVLASLVVFETVWMTVVTRRPGRWYSISLVGESPTRKNPLQPGDSARDSYLFTKRVGGNAVLRPALSFLTLSRKPLDGQSGPTEIVAEFKSPFAGEYKSDEVELCVTGPLGLLNSTCALPAKFEYSVYPRTLAMAITSAKLLGIGGVGDIPVQRVGIGTEFYDIREYQAGDDFRQINWKATARRGELMTSEHAREVGGACYLILEAVSPDYFDRDRLAAAFLGIANNLAMQGTAFGVVTHDGKSVKQVKKIDAPTASLAFALKVALKFADLDRKDFQEELAAKSSYSLRRLSKFLEDSGSLALSQITDLAISEKRTLVENQNLAQTILELTRENINDPPAILYVSGILGSVESVIELGTSVKRIYGASFVVVDPTAPWIMSRDEESAYDAYLEHSRKLKSLRNANLDYRLGEPSNLVQRLLSTPPQG
jgi:uncharacterized protein (DUF58 family)